MTFPELIAALEKAEGPSETLDLTIWKYLHSDTTDHGVWHANGIRFIAHHTEYTKRRYADANRVLLGRANEADYKQHDPLLAYTSNIDAALKLVPKGMEWSISTLYGQALVDVGLNIDETTQVHRRDGNISLALCIAALKAREAKS